MGEKEGEKKAAEVGEKKAAEGGEKKAAEGGEKKAAEGGGKKDEGPANAVLKLDLHCEGCAKKVKRAISHFEGVEKVKVDCASNKLTVTGNVDPAWLRERVEYKTKKKVDLISPQPKKDDGAAAGDKKAAEKSDPKGQEKKADDKKPKEPAVTTVVMKIRLHCDGCANKIKRVVRKNIDGVKSVKTDQDKDLVTVTGAMDVKEVVAYLQDKLKRGIEIIPPKKEEPSGPKKEAGGEKNEKKEVGGDKKPDAAAGGGGDMKPDAAAKDPKPGATVEGPKVEVNKLEYNSLNPRTHYAMPMYNQSYANQDYGLDVSLPRSYANQSYNYNYGYPQMGYAVQYSQGPPSPPPTYLNNVNDRMFSDENPNGCSVM